MRDDLRWKGKVSARRETRIERIMEDISLVIFLKTVVGIVSRSQDELSDWGSSLVISSRVAGIKKKDMER